MATVTETPGGRTGSGAGVEMPALPKPPSKPMKAALSTWEILALAVGTLRALFTPPFTWVGEFRDQAWILLKRAVLPAALSAFGFGYGAPGIQGTGIVEVLGDITRIGGIVGAATIREQAVWVTGMVVAGVVGTAICADLGARKTRDELDALAVMGVDVVRKLIAPRVLAITLLMPAMGVVVIVTEFYGIMFAYLTFGGPAGAYVEAGAYSFAAVDVVIFVVKTTVVGAIVGVVCCYKGITATGGPLGVGKAVNQAVVTSFVLVWVLNFAFNSTYLSLFPEAQTLR